MSCLCTVPCHITHMDVNVLQNLVEDDVSSGKTPTIVIAYAGYTDDKNHKMIKCVSYFKQVKL